MLDPLDPLEEVDDVEFGRAFDAEDGTMSNDSVIDRIIPFATDKLKWEVNMAVWQCQRLKIRESKWMPPTAKFIVRTFVIIV